MELTRRDAVAALAAVGAGAVLAGRQHTAGDDTPAATPGPSERRTIHRTMRAAATVVYPSGLDGIDEFVAEFVNGRLDGSEHAAGMTDTVAELNRLSGEWYGESFPDLPADDRDRMLREVGADVADEDPTGSTAERIRFYVVNELLLALYTSPAGGRLAGIDNPQGHPGGIDTYHRRPPG